MLRVQRGPEERGDGVDSSCKNAAALRRRYQRYFRECDEAGILYGEAGLALALDVSRETLRSWYDGAERPELQEEVRRAYLIIRSQLESDPRCVDKTRSKDMLAKLWPDGRDARCGGSVSVVMGRGMDESDFQ